VLEGRARQVTREDLDFYDLVIAMDSANMRELRQLAGGESERAKVRMLREFDPVSAQRGELDVPDPYYGGDGGFEEVFELVRAACEGLLERIQAGELP
jgi:protein-tyrosine phosphatase